MNQITHIQWGVDFTTRNGMRGLPELLRISEEFQSGTGYRFVGRDRREDHVIFQFTIGGCGLLIDDRGEHVLQPGMGFLCWANDPAVTYQWLPHGGEPWHLIFAAFDGQTARDIVAAYIQARGRVVQIDPSHRIISELRSWHKSNTQTVLVDATMALRLLTDLLMVCDLAAVSPSRLCDDAVALMHAHLAEPLALQELAQTLGVSREYLSRMFRRELATAPGQFYLKLRLRLAAESLATASVSVATIARAHGFADASHFGKAFRRHYGCSPGSWQSQHYRGVRSSIDSQSDTV